MKLATYYGSQGDYLSEHKQYFTEKQLNQDVRFLISTLKLNKSKDIILDLACGHGRHVNALMKKGYIVDGVDASKYLLQIAEQAAKENGITPKYYCQDIHKLKLNKKYTKIYLFFSELGLFDIDIVFKNISKHLKTGGLVLIDTDNVFRLVRHLQDKPRSRYWFDFSKMLLRDKKNSRLEVHYYTAPELAEAAGKYNLKLDSVYGGYDMKQPNGNSKRLIIVAKKVDR